MIDVPYNRRAAWRLYNNCRGNDIEVRHAWDITVGSWHSDPGHHSAVSVPCDLTSGQPGGGRFVHEVSRRRLLTVALAGQSWDRPFNDFAASLLAQLIAAARRAALAAGTAPMPAQIVRQLAGWFPPDLPSAVRWSSRAHQLSLSGLAFEYGDVEAITLVDVVLFRSETDALQNAKLWVHELTHVAQYRRWGVDAFAARYVADSGAVEREAIVAADRFATWRNGQTRFSPR